MAELRNEMPEDEDFDTILSADIDFSGTLNFEKSFLIRGRLSGEIDARGFWWSTRKRWWRPISTLPGW
jgi:cytoskeletal protein CcmA (bactofilin family)